MSTQKHTQGPWKAYLYGKDSYGRTIATVGANDGNNRICELCAVDLPVDSIEANAKLIAAAPELLKALNSVLEDLCDFQDAYPDLSNQFDGTFFRINEALAKAEGVK